MKEYVKPMLEVKNLVQAGPVSAEEDDAGSVSVVAPTSWWPF